MTPAPTLRALGLAAGAALALFTTACSSAPEEPLQPEGPLQPEEPAAPQWLPLFDGASLDGWTPKIRGYPLGEDPLGTFRVEDGLLRVSYDGYEAFEGRFGHLFFATPFSHYRLRVEYRFVGEQCPGGPGWAFRNSGVMLHGQAPETMTLDQEFPVSIEAQMLGGDGEHERSTANLCTPGTHVVIDGELVKRHCTSSTSKTYHGDQWVTLELEVRGGELIRHWMDGEVVLEYSAPQLDEGDADAQPLIAAGLQTSGSVALQSEGDPPDSAMTGRVTNQFATTLLTGGTISLQSESHPLDFRRVELLVLEE